MNAWMKNFNTRSSSHGHHGSKRHELVQHAYSRWSHAFTHSHTLTSTQLQPRGAKRQLSYYVSAHAGSFRVSAIHQTLTWTTGSLSCVRDHSCVCAYTQGLGTLTASQHNVFDSEIFLVLLLILSTFRQVHKLALFSCYTSLSARWSLCQRHII